MIELIIFDCDGVLVDSETMAAEVLTQALIEVGLPATVEETISRYRGLSKTSCMADIESRCEACELICPRDFWPQMQAATFKAFALDLKEISGAKTLLQHLQSNKRAFCVASSGDYEKLTLTLTTTSLLPLVEGRVFSAVEVTRGKPAPDLFLYAAKKMSARPERCLVVEDSLPGVQAALAAGMKVLALGLDPELLPKTERCVAITELAKVRQYL